MEEKKSVSVTKSQTVETTDDDCIITTTVTNVNVEYEIEVDDELMEQLTNQYGECDIETIIQGRAIMASRSIVDTDADVAATPTTTDTAVNVIANAANDADHIAIEMNDDLNDTNNNDQQKSYIERYQEMDFSDEYDDFVIISQIEDPPTTTTTDNNNDGNNKKLIIKNYEQKPWWHIDNFLDIFETVFAFCFYLILIIIELFRSLIRKVRN